MSGAGPSKADLLKYIIDPIPSNALDCGLGAVKASMPGAFLLCLPKLFAFVLMVCFLLCSTCVCNATVQQ